MSESGNGAIILRAPDAPVDLINDPEITNSTQIGIIWSDGTWNGGSPIIDYRISYAIGMSGTFTILDTVSI